MFYQTGEKIEHISKQKKIKKNVEFNSETAHTVIICCIFFPFLGFCAFC